MQGERTGVVLRVWWILAALLGVWEGGVLAGLQDQSPTNPPGDQPPSSMIQAQTTRAEQRRYLYDPGMRRDPFIPLFPSGASHDQREDSASAQQTSMSDLTVLGIMSGSLGYRAVIQTTGGTRSIVVPGAVVEASKWMVKESTDTSVILQERGVDRMGKRQTGTKVITLFSSP